MEPGDVEWREESGQRVGYFRLENPLRQKKELLVVRECSDGLFLTFIDQELMSDSTPKEPPAGSAGGWVARTGLGDGIEDLQAGPWRGNTWRRAIGTVNRWSGVVYHEQREAMHSAAYYTLTDAREWVEKRLTEIAERCEREAEEKTRQAVAIRAALSGAGAP